MLSPIFSCEYFNRYVEFPFGEHRYVLEGKPETYEDFLQNPMHGISSSVPGKQAPILSSVAVPSCCSTKNHGDAALM